MVVLRAQVTMTNLIDQNLYCGTMTANKNFCTLVAFFFFITILCHVKMFRSDTQLFATLPEAFYSSPSTNTLFDTGNICWCEAAISCCGLSHPGAPFIKRSR